LGSTTASVLTINKGGGSVTLGNAITVLTYTHTAGTFDASTYLLTATNNTLTAGTLRVGATTWAGNYSFTPTPPAGFTIEYYNANPTINAAITYQNLAFSGTGTANASAALTVQGNLTNTGGGTLNFGANGVTLSGTVATQSIAGFTTTGTVSMTKTASSTATFQGNVNGGALTINGSGGTLNLGTGLTHTFTGAFTRTVGTINLSSSTLNIGGTTTNTAGTFTAGTSTVNYNGAAQTIANVTYYNLTLSGTLAKTTTGATVNGTLSMQGTATASAAPTYGGSATLEYKGSAAQTTGPELTATIPNLTINNANGVNLNSSPTVSGTLTLTSGNISTGSYTVIISGSVSHTSGHVVGNLQKNVATGAPSRTFEVGTANNYNPVDVAFGDVSVAGNLTAKATAGDHGSLGSSTINPSKSVNVYWTLTNSGITFDNYSATFTFVSDDIDVGADTNSFIVGKYTSSTWSYPTVGAKTATSTQATGITTSFGDFAVGEPLVPNISNTPTSYNFGVLAEGAIAETTGGLTTAYFTVTNNSAYAVNITISGTDMTGGTTWTLSNTATPGVDTYGLKAGLEGSSYIIVKSSSPNFLVEGLASLGTQDWGLQILAPTTFTGGGANSGTVTLTATQA